MSQHKFIEFPATNQSKSRRRLTQGVGVNDADYNISTKVDGVLYRCPYYRKWIHMLERGYCLKYKAKQPTYKDVTVCEDWLIFSNFRKRMVDQDWQGKELDKDIIVIGNKLYSPETCCFVERRVNSLLNDHKNARGRYLQGVVYDSLGEYRPSGRYRARSNDGTGKLKHLGWFDTEQEAHEAYTNYKSELITRRANDEVDDRIKAGLLRHAEKYKIGDLD